MAAPNMKDLEKRMQGALEALKHEFTGLRTGRAHISLLDTVMVESYGSSMPINQVGTVSTPESRSLSVQVWDKNNVKAVEKGIRNSGLGLNPVVDGMVVRVPIPELTEERRAELAKVAASYSENAKIAIRNVRRHGMDDAKSAEKDGDFSEDDRKKAEDVIQKLTDNYVEKVDGMLSEKQQEIMQV
ncbi:ribosome recycling factor [uncultured Sneathiella sp.]|jgi:ribosome recycling factor|uniref:ribosome recycling factor n=1 Tax=uncultured Sneathiella sp. TaxID=879315 RepID=UPI0030D7F345|tara:strand:- start:19510 stop:20067 length:558 start_codon:yes stop_codon:yes gene_type:complete